jgi:hypothetical protein
MSSADRQQQPVILFTSAQVHRSVNGYEANFNTPAARSHSTHWEVVILFLVVHHEQRTVCLDLSVWSIRFHAIHIDVVRRRTNPSVFSSDQQENGEMCLDHRVQGNRIICESVLGEDHRTGDTKMLLYGNSTQCTTAIELFLQCHPQYRNMTSMRIENHHRLWPNVDLDLYNATAIAVRECLRLIWVVSFLIIRFLCCQIIV